MSKFYITTPIYYVNDKAHIGHAYTTIAADFLARYHRLRGEEVFFLTGTDEHGSKVAESAVANKMTPQEFCDMNSAKFQMLWDRLDITQNLFIRTTANYHKKGVTQFLQKLKDVGAIYEGEYEGLYCTGCEKFITEKDLVNGQCPDHKRAPEVVKEKNYFFNLEKYLPQVENMIDRGELKIMPESRHKEVLGLIKQGLENFSVSRQSVKWGIEVPFDQSQVTYVWVEALQNYITGIGYGTDEAQYKKFWPAEIHLMAKDIIKFHALYWPAMLIAAGEPVPKVIFAHGFFTVDGQKMSKTIGNVIDPDNLLDQFGSDAVRYLLLSQFPFGQDGDIKAGNFAIQYNADLANGIGNLVSRVLAMAEKYFSGKLPTASDPDLLKDKVIALWPDYDKALAGFKIDQAIEIIKKLNSLCDSFVEETKPWGLAKTDEQKLASVIINLVEAIRHLGLMIYPVMPQTAEKIMAALGQENFSANDFNTLRQWGGLKAGDQVRKVDALFPRLQ